MAKGDVIKLDCKLFEDPIIIILESLPDGNKILAIWLKLVCLAAREGYDGVFMLAPNLPHTEETLSTVLRMPLEDIKRALGYFKQYGMISVVNGRYVIPHRWRHGAYDKTFQERTAKEYKEWRESVFERDGYKCQQCGQKGGKLNAHHIMPFAKYPELRLDVGNGITLCEKCHRDAHRRRRAECQIE